MIQILRFLAVRIIAMPLVFGAVVSLLIGFVAARNLSGLIVYVLAVLVVAVFDHVTLNGRLRAMYRSWASAHSEKVLTRSSWGKLTDDLKLSKTYSDESFRRPKLRRVEVMRSSADETT